MQRANLKEALRKYFDELVQQAAVMSIDWWDKLKPLRINTKGKKVLFPTARHAADGWVQGFANTT